MKHLDRCTHMQFAEDRDILTRKLFDVNMRLFNSSLTYLALVCACADYILQNAQTKLDGYSKPKGFSGANAGIPFNIIATPEEPMLNPHLLNAEGIRKSVTNCGSLTLDKPVEIWRYAEITFEYWDLDGNRHVKTGYLPTIQHEIEHNQGLLITDNYKRWMDRDK